MDEYPAFDGVDPYDTVRSIDDERSHRKRMCAIGYRILAAQRWGQLGDGHVSARDPELADHFWLLDWGVPFGEATVDQLVLVGPDGQVALRLQAFEYLAAPALTAVTPALGGVSGGNQLTLVGDNFETGMQVFFGSLPGQVLAVESANSALVRTPSAQIPGFVDVKIRNPDVAMIHEG